MITTVLTVRRVVGAPTAVPVRRHSMAFVQMENVLAASCIPIIVLLIVSYHKQFYFLSLAVIAVIMVSVAILFLLSSSGPEGLSFFR